MTSYLHWSKTHRRVRYELTGSGAPFVQPAELDFAQAPLRLEVRGSYGDPELIECIAARYGVATQHVLPVPGASGANFFAIAACTDRGDRIALELPTRKGASADPLAITGVVVRCDRTAKSRGHFDTAIYFEELTGTVRLRLEQFVASRRG